ncbi:MAG TPA: ATP-binding protein [Solirubrobacteraceae bacterium]|nr:ATP-binding protein [Solirubrobacteraceae bacterium]
MIAATVVVVAIDVAAAVLQIVSDHRTQLARDGVTTGLGYQTETAAILRYTLDGETAQRGYLLTGEASYLLPLHNAVRQAPAVLRAIRAGSAADPVLRRDYRSLVALLRARLRDIVGSIGLYRHGARARAIALVRSGAGNRITERIRRLVAGMSARSVANVEHARSFARGAEVWASRAALAAYLSSALLLVVLVTLLRAYRLTEAARRESRLAQLEAERLNQAKSGFLSRVSHELRTPLGAILGYGQLLERELVDRGERETLDQLLAAGRHLLAIVDDLLDLSQIESGNLRLSLEPVQVADVLAEAKALIGPAAMAATVGVRQRPVGVDLYVRADRQRLIQVLLNLVSNAVKYNRRGGNVVISAGRAGDGSVVRFEVADTGAGISPAAMERLFTPFERLDAARRGIEGTGLGLALARGLVDAMGGRLTLTSVEGVGTTVAVELPVSAAEEQAGLRRLRPGGGRSPAARVGLGAPAGRAAGAGAASSGPAGALRAATSVLYIEDNPSNVRLVEQIFALASDLGLHVAHEGSAGVALARELRPDLVLLDLHLPDISGEQVLAALRSDPELGETPVIIVSADASPMQARRLLAAGANGYLTKPFDIDQLLAAVRARGTATPELEDLAQSDGLLDLPMVQSLHVLSSNAAVGPRRIGEMLETFCYDARAMLSGVHEAVAEANLAAAQREAHRLAGGAGAVGAGRLRAACKDLETVARAGNLERSRTLDATLDQLLDETWAALRDEFAAELGQAVARAPLRSPPTR